mgnify:CR=1 FL=1
MTFSVVLFPFGFFLAFSYGLVCKDDANGWGGNSCPDGRARLILCKVNYFCWKNARFRCANVKFIVSMPCAAGRPACAMPVAGRFAKDGLLRSKRPSFTR